MMEVFVDISRRELNGLEATAFAIIAVDRSLRVCNRWIGPCVGSTTVACEIDAAAIALERITPQRHVIIWSDIDLQATAYGRVSYSHKMRPQIDRLLKATRRHEKVDFREVNRRNGTYRHCHKLARIAASRILRGEDVGRI